MKSTIFPIDDKISEGIAQNINYPKVSVCMPTYNRAASLRRCLASLMLLTYPNLEIIVCDNNSTDNTKDIISLYPKVKYIYEEKQGTSYAKNALLRACSSDSVFVVFVDDDETVQPRWIEYLLSGFVDDTVAVVGGPCHNIPVIIYMKKNFLIGFQILYIRSLLRRRAVYKRVLHFWGFWGEMACVAYLLCEKRRYFSILG